jgi:hypothetical protein
MVKVLEVSDETYERIKSQLKDNEKTDINRYEDLVGKKWFFRTVTYHCVGKVTKVFGHIIRLEDASWIADSGRFMNFLKEGEASEVEPVGEMYLNMNTVIDFFAWKHDLFKEQK